MEEVYCEFFGVVLKGERVLFWGGNCGDGVFGIKGCCVDIDVVIEYLGLVVICDDVSLCGECCWIILMECI